MPADPDLSQPEHARVRPGGSLRVRLTLLLATALLPAVLLLVYTGLERQRYERATAEQDLMRLAELTAASQAQLLANTRSLMAVMAQFPEVRAVVADETAATSAACSARLAEVLPLYPLYAGLGVADINGIVVCSSNQLTTAISVQERLWFQQAVQTGEFAVGEYQASQRLARPVLVLGYPVMDAAGRPQAVVSVALDLAALNEAAATTPLPTDAVLVMIDQNGTILARTNDAAQWVGQRLPETPLVSRLLAQGRGISELPSLDGEQRVYAYLPVPAMGTHPIRLALGRPGRALYSPAGTQMARDLTSLGLIAALALITIWQGSRLLLLQPMAGLLRATRRLTEGDLAARSGLAPYQSETGELGQLAHAFDHLADTLQQRSAERQQAEAALRISEEHYRRLVELSPDTIFVALKGRLAYINSAGAQLLGASQPAALIGRPVVDTLVHPADRELVAQRLEASAHLAQGQHLPYTQVRWLKLDGQPLEVEIGASPIEHDGQPAALVILRDLTARKQLEARVQALAQAAHAFAMAGPDYEAVLELVGAQAGQLLGDLCYVRLLSDDGTWLRSAAIYHPDPAMQAHLEQLNTEPTPATEGMSGQVVRSGQALLLPDLAPDAYRELSPAKFWPFYEQFGLASALTVPLRSRGRTMGVMGLSRRRAGRPYTLDDQDFAQELADRAALAIDNARLFVAEHAARQTEQAARAEAEQAAQAARQQTERITRLQAVTSALSALLDANQAAQVVVEQGAAMLQAAAGAILLPSADGLALELLHAVGYPPEVLEARRRLPLEQGRALADAFLTAQPLWFESHAAFAGRYSHGVAERIPHGYEAMAIAPLALADQCLGVMVFTFQAPRQFEPEDQEFMLTLARQYAQAQERARLYAEARQLNAELEQRVAQRTAQLAAANTTLEAEVAERRRMEVELARSGEQLRQLNAYVQAAREEERTRISREIHDELGGALTGLKMDVARARRGVDQPNPLTTMQTRLDGLSAAIDAMVQTVRRIATDLRPALLDDFGLAAAIEWQLGEFEKRAGLECSFSTNVDELDWNSGNCTAVFRAFQEALTNVARHAEATRVEVSLVLDEDQFVLQVRDNGRGISTGELAGLKSLGLAGMRERVQLLSGDLHISGTLGQGTTILITIPKQHLLAAPAVEARPA